MDAPYGGTYWGPLSIKAKYGWVLMESPGIVSFGFIFIQNVHRYNELNSRGIVVIITFVMFMAHYVYRAFIFPFKQSGKVSSLKVIFTCLCVLRKNQWAYSS